MNRMIKYAAAAGTAGLLALGMAAPSYAAHGRSAAAANANPTGDYNGYYGPGYGYQARGYGYQTPGYAHDSQAGYGAYAYAPGHPGINNTAMPSCAIQGTYGKPVDMADCY